MACRPASCQPHVHESLLNGNLQRPTHDTLVTHPICRLLSQLRAESSEPSIVDLQAAAFWLVPCRIM